MPLAHRGHPLPETQSLRRPLSSGLPPWALPVHVAAVVLIQSTQTAVVFILGVLAKKHFQAGDTSVLVIQAAPTVFFVLSIFWNDYFERRSVTRYLAVFWLVCCLPMVAAYFATSVWMLIVPHLIASLGGSAYHPVAGELLKRLYPDSRRGRVYAIMWGTAMTVGAFACYGVGEWLNYDPESFRIYIPAAAGIQLVGVALMAWLARVTGVEGARTIRADSLDGSRLSRMLDPIVHMGSLLKADPTFARYEAAYMTYGVGWMVVYALIPLIATVGLGLRYDQYAESAQVPYMIAVVAMLLPAGWLMDKLGAVRSTAISFLMLAGYPLGLIWVLRGHSAHELLIVSVWYGMAHAGASVGWMLGPVALAPGPDKVPKYVAVHATLVGLRGAVFQGLGVGLYKLTGSFVWPLAIAGAAYVWSAFQMWALHGRMRLKDAGANGRAGIAPVTADPEI